MPTHRTLVTTRDASTMVGAALFLDCRFDLSAPSWGRTQFRETAIAAARFVDLNQTLSSPVIPKRTGRHPLPEREALAQTLRNLGLGQGQQVICYDQAPGAFAARAWWLLRWLGHEAVAVLDGGLRAWLADGLPVAPGSDPPNAPGNFTAGMPLTRQVNVTELHDARWLLDAREPPRYRGEIEPIDPVAGHIPDAVNVPYIENLNADGRWRDRESLKTRFDRIDIVAGDDIAVYCGSGVTACHTILALVHAGFPEPQLYPGSFSEWITDPARPVSRGPQP